MHKAIMQMDTGKLTQIMSSSDRLTELSSVSCLHACAFASVVPYRDPHLTDFTL
jgi:hypothetical protein